MRDSSIDKHRVWLFTITVIGILIIYTLILTPEALEILKNDITSYTGIVLVSIMALYVCLVFIESLVDQHYSKKLSIQKAKREFREIKESQEFEIK